MPEVPWATFVTYPDGDEKFSEDWLLNPANVVSLFPDGAAYCRLCDSYFTGSPAKHVAGHEASLRTWQEQRTAEGYRANANKISSELAAEAQRLRAEGKSVGVIAKEIGRSRSRVSYYLRQVRGKDEHSLKPAFLHAKSGQDAVQSEGVRVTVVPLAVPRQKAHTVEAHAKRRQTFKSKSRELGEQARALQEEGMAEKAIADQLGVSDRSLRRYLAA